GAGPGDTHADRGLVIYVVRNVPDLRSRYQRALGPGTERQNRTLAEIHSTAVFRATDTFATNHTGILDPESISAEHVPTAQAGGVDVNHDGALLRLRFAKLAYYRWSIALGNDGCTHANLLLVCLVVGVEARVLVEHFNVFCPEIMPLWNRGAGFAISIECPQRGDLLDYQIICSLFVLLYRYSAFPQYSSSRL